MNQKHKTSAGGIVGNGKKLKKSDVDGLRPELLIRLFAPPLFFFDIALSFFSPVLSSLSHFLRVFQTPLTPKLASN